MLICHARWVSGTMRVRLRTIAHRTAVTRLNYDSTDERGTNIKARTRGSPGKSDGGSGHQLNDTTVAFHFDPGGVAWIHTDDHTLPADP
jgi:hypothetical protein